jgi:hypothetical protein
VFTARYVLGPYIKEITFCMFRVKRDQLQSENISSPSKVATLCSELRLLKVSLKKFRRRGPHVGQPCLTVCTDE